MFDDPNIIEKIFAAAMFLLCVVYVLMDKE